MSRISFCCLCVILAINSSFAVPAFVIKSPLNIARVKDSLDHLNLHNHNHELMKNILHEYLCYIRNYLSSFRSVAKAMEKVLKEDFNVHKWQSSQSAADSVLKNVYDSCIYIQQFVNATESMLAPPGHIKEHSDSYIYKKAYYGLKGTFSTMRDAAAEIVKSYHYYAPEVTFITCVGNYVKHTYPEMVYTSLAAFPISFAEYAYKMVNDFVKTFQNTNLELEHKNVNIENAAANTKSVQNLPSPQVQWAFEQLLSDSNEISQYRELNSKLSYLGKYLLQIFNFDKIATKHFGGAVETPMKCIQQYAFEFFLKRTDLFLSR